MAQPSDKSFGIENLIGALNGKNRAIVIAANECMTCNGPANEFKDDLSRKEYTISGMCQKCQDSFFIEPEEEE